MAKSQQLLIMETRTVQHLTLKVGPRKRKKRKLPALKTITMLEEYEKKKRKQVANMRAMMDYGIGILIFGAGIFFFFRNKFPLSFNENFPPNEMDKIFGAICVIYGGWRIYRGYKKNYFR